MSCQFVAPSIVVIILTILLYMGTGLRQIQGGPPTHIYLFVVFGLLYCRKCIVVKIAKYGDKC